MNSDRQPRGSIPDRATNIWRLTLVPLDVTDRVPVTTTFLQRLARQRRYPFSDLAGQLWAFVAHNPSYCFWDTLTTAALGNPALVQTRPERCRIITSGLSLGRTEPCLTGGRLVDAAHAVDIAAFHELMLAQLAR